MKKKKVETDIDFKKFSLDTFPLWLQGNGNVASLSTVCLRRNIKGHLFPHKMSNDERFSVAKEIHQAISKTDLSKALTYHCLDKMDNIEKCLLFERKWCDAFFVDNNQQDSIFIYGSADERVKIIVNNDDHLEIRVSSPEIEFLNCYKKAVEISESLDLEYSYLEPFGYLTASPALMGAAINAECILHTPTVLLGETRPKWMDDMEQKGYIIGGFFGMGSPIMGNYISINNKNTHRSSAEQILRGSQLIADALIKMEEDARKDLDVSDRKDIVARAYGTLRYAVKIDFEEAMTGMGYIKMGIDVGLIQNIKVDEWKRAMRDIFPFHLEALAKYPKDEESFVRASMIREFINQKRG
jgi:protein arginine kinase